MNTDGLILDWQSRLAGSNPCFQGNIAALAVRQPAVSAVVEATAMPDSVSAAIGRDGTPTFVIVDADGRSRWFGGSSMPGISAREVFDGFISDGRSVVLPGVLTGREPFVLAEKLPLHAAVFVVEDDPAQLKLAFSAHDYSELISTGRVVFVLGGAEDMVEPACWMVAGLCTIFEAHPGYEFPNHLLPVPQRTTRQISGLQDRLEQAGRRIAEIYVRTITKTVERLQQQSRGAVPAAPTVAVLGVDPSPRSQEQARRIDRALTQLGWPHALCVPDAPDRCHLAARISTVESVGADLVLLVNTAKGLAGVDLPADLPVASWHLPGSELPARETLPTDDGRLFFASTGSVTDELVAAGCAADAIEHCGVAADTVAFRSVDPAVDRNIDVVVIADLPDVQPQSYNITLDSHVALWHAMTDVVRRHVDEDALAKSEKLLREAERVCHAEVREPKVRKQFVHLLEDRLVPAVRARAAVEALRDAGFRIQVWGTNWSKIEVAADVQRGPIPGAEALNLVFNAARVVVMVDSSAWGVQSALDAIASGAVVVCRQGDKPFDQEHPGLAEIRMGLHLYRKTSELLGHVGSLVRASDMSDPAAAAALVRSEYSVSRRLEQMAEMIRERRARPTSG